MEWVPEGWKCSRFKEIIDKYIDNRGKTPPLSAEGVPLIEVKHIQENAINPLLTTEKHVSPTL
jgi:type I restriction enzyme S subunit